MSTASNSKVKEITYIAIGVATLIAGGFAIFQISMFFPIPGIKYILMSPYLSMVIFILLSKVNDKFALLKIGFTFGLIMMMINMYMGLTIVLTSILSQISINYLKDSFKISFGAVLFSVYAGISALLVSKYIIGGVFKEISNFWLLITGFICMIFGVIGVYLAKKIIKYLPGYNKN